MSLSQNHKEKLKTGRARWMANKSTPLFAVDDIAAFVDRYNYVLKVGSGPHAKVTYPSTLAGLVNDILDLQQKTTLMEDAKRDLSAVLEALARAEAWMSAVLLPIVEQVEASLGRKS